jgi:ABC-type dipeptide/oligopeptide/nickel transport system permease subunit
MESCRAVGVPAWRQFTLHLLPNLVGPIVVYATLAVPAAILSESFLSFLGIGVREPVPSWGNLASAGLAEVNLVDSRWWLLAAPCAMIAATLVALNFVGDSLRARFDPAAARARW